MQNIIQRYVMLSCFIMVVYLFHFSNYSFCQESSILGEVSHEAFENQEAWNASLNERVLVDEKIIKHFCVALAQCLKTPAVGALIKNAIGNKFSGDYEVLWRDIQNSYAGNSQLATIIDNSMKSAAVRRYCGTNYTIRDLNQFPVLHLALPEQFQNWNTNVPIRVCSYPMNIDDRYWVSTIAYDQNYRTTTLSAANPPSFPVLVVGMNERVDQKTMRLYRDIEKEQNILKENKLFNDKRNKIRTLQSESEVKASKLKDLQLNATENIDKTRSEDPYSAQLYLEWFYVINDHDPWPKGKGEFMFNMLAENGVVSSAGCDAETNGVYHWSQMFFYLYRDCPRAVSLKVYEQDWGGQIQNVNIGINTPLIQVSGTFDIKSDDDFVGQALSVDLRFGPHITNRNDFSVKVPCGDITYALWYEMYHNDLLPQPLPTNPYFREYTNVAKKDKWLVQGPQGEDGCHVFEVSEYGTYTFSTDDPYTNFDTKLEIFDLNGTTGLYNDDINYGNGNTKSEIRGAHLNKGVYFVVVDGWNGATGNYMLIITKE